MGSFANIGVPGLIIILLIVVILFGGKRIAEVAKGLGTGVKNFKNAVKDEENSQDAEAGEEEVKVIEEPKAKKTAAKPKAKTTKKA
jgi:sec-independent protein translocase protein TatA